MFFKKFKEQKETIQEKLSELVQMKREKEDEKTLAEREYRRMLAEEGLGSSDYKQSDFNKAKQKIEKIDEELQGIQDRIDALQEAKDSKLKSELAELKRERDKIVSEASAEMKAMIRDLRQYKAEYLLAVRKINEIYRRATDADGQYKQLARQFDPNVDRDFIHLPATNLYATYGRGGNDTMIGIRQDEVDRAITTGQVPLWVEHFEQTGEVLASDEEGSR